jgi:hypothetical protein
VLPLPLLVLRAWCWSPFTRRRYCPTLKCLVGWPSLQQTDPEKHGKQLRCLVFKLFEQVWVSNDEAQATSAY